MRRNKYGAVKTTVNGERFDSKAEAARWADLKMLEKSGQIVGLKRQVPFRLIVNGMLVATYVADYTYSEVKTGEIVTEDCKSPATVTPTFRLKQKLMKALFGIDVKIHMTGKPSWSLDTAKGRWLRKTPRRTSRTTSQPMSD